MIMRYARNALVQKGRLKDWKYYEANITQCEEGNKSPTNQACWSFHPHHCACGYNIQVRLVDSALVRSAPLNTRHSIIVDILQPTLQVFLVVLLSVYLYVLQYGVYCFRFSYCELWFSLFWGWNSFKGWFEWREPHLLIRSASVLSSVCLLVPSLLPYT
jgi:hypothetical protein